MKNINNKSKTAMAVFAFAILLVAGIYSCKKPTEGINLIVDTAPLSKSPTLVVFSNANQASTTPIPSNFTVTITGSGAPYVQADGGGQNFTTNNGFLPLSLVKGASPSASNPIVFNVYANVPGFAPVSKTITISNDTTVSQVNVSLVEYTNPPAGSSALVSTIPMTNNTVASLTKLSTAANSNLSETASLSIPAGTQMLDASGAVIAAGSINSSIIQYGTNNQLIGASFPGGLSPANVLDDSGKPISGGVQFVTAGALGINMQAGNSVVKSFSKTITATVELQSGLINFMTGNPVKAGETIPVWSYNETTGQWKSDGTATVALNGNGKLAASFGVNHLSCWNLDWTWYPNPVFNSVVHNLAVNFIPSNSTQWTGTYFVQLQTANGNLLSDFFYYPQSDFYIQQSTTPTGVFQNVPNVNIKGKYGFGLTVVPNISQAKVMVYDYQKGIYYYSALFNPTTTSSVNVNITTPPPPSYVNVALNINALCTNKNIVAKPTGWFYLYDVTANSYYAYIYLYNGTISYAYLANTVKASADGSKSSVAVQLVSNHSYWIASYYNGSYNQSGNFVVSNASFPIPASSTFSGSSSYNASTSTVTINGTVTLKCN